MHLFLSALKADGQLLYLLSDISICLRLMGSDKKRKHAGPGLDVTVRCKRHG